MQSAKLFEILSNYNRFWLSGRIDTGAARVACVPLVKFLLNLVRLSFA
jgi:hypothetical protein